jgi:hypothetical protein
VIIEDNININFIKDYWDLYLPEELAVFSDMSTFLDLADFYQVFKSPNVYIFDSFDHLIELLEAFEWKDDKEILEVYENNIKNSWLKVLKNILI